jgi:hypothetical protein
VAAAWGTTMARRREKRMAVAVAAAWGTTVDGRREDRGGEGAA